MKPLDLFDSHCHLTDAAFRDDLGAVFRRAVEAGVTRVVCIASDVDDARAAVELAGSRPGVWSTAGVHPHAAGDAAPDAMDRILALLSGHSEIVAVGETGLDFHYDNAPRDVQRDLFDAHLELANSLNLPAVVHARDADREVAAALGNMAVGTRGVLHCFTGGERAFAAAMEHGWYVSFSGIASFKSFEAADLLRTVPEDRLMVETDSPYLAPQPVRGKRNEPAHVRHVAEAVAGHLGSTLEDVAALTAANALAFYGLGDGSPRLTSGPREAIPDSGPDAGGGV